MTVIEALRYWLPGSALFILAQEWYDGYKLLKAEPEVYSVDEVLKKTYRSRWCLAVYSTAGLIAILGFCHSLSHHEYVMAYTGILLAQIPPKIGYHIIMLQRMKKELPIAQTREVMEE